MSLLYTRFGYNSNLNAAITSLRAGDGLVAIQSIEAALHVEVERDPELFEQSLHGATAALDDLRRMFAESLS